MRILFWTSFYWPQLGGLETICEQLVRELKKRGHEICVVTAHGHLDLPDIDEHDGVPIQRFDFWRAMQQRDPVALLMLQRRVAALKAEFRADVIHINCTDPSVVFHMQTAHVHPAPYVFTPHGLILDSFLAPNSLLGSALRDADWVTAVAEHQLASILVAFPQLESRSTLIVNGLSAPKAGAANTYPDNQKILCIGRIVKEKGFDVAVEAFALVAAEFPLARLLIAGIGPEDRAIRARVNALRLNDRVDFLGGVEHETVSRLIGEVAIVAMPSRSEPFGLVAVEAGQMARPIIASAVGGLGEIVVDGETGRLVADGDVEGFASAMGELLRDPRLARAMGRAGLERARTLYTSERHTTQFENLFLQLTREKSHAGAH